MARKKRQLKYGQWLGNISCTPFKVEGNELPVGKSAADEQPPAEENKKKGKEVENAEFCGKGKKGRSQTRVRR